MDCFVFPFFLNMNKGVRWPLRKWNIVLWLRFDWNGSWFQWTIWNSSLFLRASRNDILMFHIKWNGILMFHLKWNGSLFFSAGWHSPRSIIRVLNNRVPISPLSSHPAGPCCVCPSSSPCVLLILKLAFKLRIFCRS